MLLKHCKDEHQGEKVKFKMDVSGYHHNNDSTKRQVTEGLEIQHNPDERLMNSKSLWNTPSMPSCISRIHAILTRLSERCETLFQ